MVSVIRQQDRPVCRTLGFDLKEIGLDQSSLPALIAIIQNEFFFPNAKGNVPCEPAFAKSIGDMKVVSRILERLLKDLAAGIGGDRPPAFGPQTLIGLVSDGDIDQIDRAVAHPQACLGLLLRQGNGSSQTEGQDNEGTTTSMPKGNRVFRTGRATQPTLTCSGPQIRDGLRKWPT